MREWGEGLLVLMWEECWLVLIRVVRIDEEEGWEWEG